AGRDRAARDGPGHHRDEHPVERELTRSESPHVVIRIGQLANWPTFVRLADERTVLRDDTIALRVKTSSRRYGKRSTFPIPPPTLPACPRRWAWFPEVLASPQEMTFTHLARGHRAGQLATLAK